MAQEGGWDNMKQQVTVRPYTHRAALETHTVSAEVCVQRWSKTVQWALSTRVVAHDMNPHAAHPPTHLLLLLPHFPPPQQTYKPPYPPCAYTAPRFYYLPSTPPSRHPWLPAASTAPHR